MRCPSCKTTCLDTDKLCLNCRRPLNRPPERSAANFCGFLFAAFGAAVMTFGPTTNWLNDNKVVLAGIGGLAGAVIGVIVGLVIDWLGKKSDGPTVPNSVASRIRPSTRR